MEGEGLVVRVTVSQIRGAQYPVQFPCDAVVFFSAGRHSFAMAACTSKRFQGILYITDVIFENINPQTVDGNRSDISTSSSGLARYVPCRKVRQEEREELSVM